MQVLQPGDTGQQDVESEDKNCASYNCSIRNNREGIDQKLQWLPGRPSAIELQKVTLKSTAHIICKVLGRIA